ncbi:hypothetical protein F4604DRAFT_1788298 [Suillus subluteus]|nr:hypothetical protein F4604DRAFT_1788298 [Suillus subluteus]
MNVHLRTGPGVLVVFASNHIYSACPRSCYSAVIRCVKYSLKSRPHLVKSDAASVIKSSPNHVMSGLSQTQHILNICTNVNLHTFLCRVKPHLGNKITYLPASVQITWLSPAWMTLPLRIKPRLRLDPGALPPSSSFVQAARLDSRLHSHCHVSNFRSLLLNMQLYSPSIKAVKQVGLGGIVSCPVFGDHDKVEGKVILDLNCSQNGRLNISIEGVMSL